mgnify:CR=1 FL=1
MHGPCPSIAAKFVPELFAVQRCACVCRGKRNTENGVRAESALSRCAVESDECCIESPLVANRRAVQCLRDFAIHRSDGAKGISCLVIDKDMPGVSFGAKERKLGWNASPTAQVMFDNVKVPKENRVGEEGQGWTIGKRLLQHERTNISGGGAAARMMGANLSDLAKKYLELGDDGRIADAVMRDRIADFEIRWQAFLLTAKRAVEESKAAGGVSEISSVLKKLGTKLTQERSELTIEIMGLQGLGWEGDGFSESELGGVRAWLFGKATTIYGGSTEIQNNIIAKRVLGMLDHQ